MYECYIKLKKDWDWTMIFSASSNPVSEAYEQYWNNVYDFFDKILCDCFSIVRFEGKMDRFLLLTKDIDNPECFRLSYFDNRGPVMHDIYEPNEKELHKMYREIASFSEDTVVADVFYIDDIYPNDYFTAVGWSVTEYDGFYDVFLE